MFVRLGMSEYYGSEGFDRPPPDVYSCLGGFVFSTRVATRAATRVAPSAMTGLGRERLSPWHLQCEYGHLQ